MASTPPGNAGLKPAQWMGVTRTGVSLRPIRRISSCPGRQGQMQEFRVQSAATDAKANVSEDGAHGASSVQLVSGFARQRSAARSNRALSESG